MAASMEDSCTSQTSCSSKEEEEEKPKIFRNEEERESEALLPPPKDKFFLIYVVFLLNGGAIWLGWNLINFLGPNYYFDYWFSMTAFHIPTNYAMNFLTHIGEIACSPLFVFAILAIIPIVWIPLYLRFLVSIIGSIVAMIVLLIAACDWNPKFHTSQEMAPFYTFSIVVICVYMGFVGVFQTHLYGMAADFPSSYTTAVVIGTNAGGIIASLCYVFSTAANPKTADSIAIGYYSFVVAYLILCAASVFILWKSEFFQHYQQRAEEKRKEVCCDPRRFFRNMGEVFSNTWKELLNMFMIIFTMYGIFPSLSVGIQPWPTPGMAHLKPYFLPIGTFLNFYVLATIGSIASLFIKISPKNTRMRTFLMVPCYASIYSILFFMYCNYIPNPPKKRAANVVFKNEWFYFIGNGILGLFMGFMSGILFTLIPKAVRPELSRLASSMAAATLVTGLYMGSGMSTGFSNIVSN